MSPFLNYSAGTYEAIIGGLVVVGLIQAVALRRKQHQVAKLTEVIRVATKAVVNITSAGLAAITKTTVRCNEAIALAEQAARDAMEARADADDARDELRAFVQTDQVNPPELASLLDMIRGSDQPKGKDLLDTIFSGPRRSAQFTALPFSVDDVKAALQGDVSRIERALNGVPGSTTIEVRNRDGKVLEGAEREAAIDEIMTDQTRLRRVILNEHEHELNEERISESPTLTIDETAHGFEPHKVEYPQPDYHTTFPNTSPRAG